MNGLGSVKSPGVRQKSASEYTFDRGGRGQKLFGQGPFQKRGLPLAWNEDQQACRKSKHCARQIAGKLGEGRNCKEGEIEAVFPSKASQSQFHSICCNAPTPTA